MHLAWKEALQKKKEKRRENTLAGMPKVHQKINDTEWILSVQRPFCLFRIIGRWDVITWSRNCILVLEVHRDLHPSLLGPKQMVSEMRKISLKKGRKARFISKKIYQMILGGLAITNKPKGYKKLGPKMGRSTKADTYAALASLTRTLGLFKSSRKRWLCSVSLRSFNSDMVDDCC